MTTTSALKQILAKFFQEVWNEGNVEVASKYLAPRYTIYHDPGDPWDKKELDLEEFKKRVRLSRAPFPDQHFIIEGLFAEENVVVVTWRWTGTHKGDLPGFPASGKTVSMSGITVYYFREERITGHWQVIDRFGVFQQLRQSPVSNQGSNES